jgi:hypothetical protein
VEKQKKSIPIVPIVFGLIAAVLVAVVLFGGGTEVTGEAIAFGEVQVAGSPIARLPEGSADPAIGAPIPEVVGADFDGNTVSILNDGRPKILLFLAHW